MYVLVYISQPQTRLFPTIFMYWKKYQTEMLEQVKALHDGVVIAGDGRHDSMGHSAKYCGYSIFSCTVPMIFFFSCTGIKRTIPIQFHNSLLEVILVTYW